MVGTVFTPPAFHPKALRFIFYLAGLLACFLFTAFPSRLSRDSGCSVNFFPLKRNETHSYGDSAGITPDFPFNPAMAGTRFCKCKTVNEKREEFIFWTVY
jgi:hypothetical protein